MIGIASLVGVQANVQAEEIAVRVENKSKPVLCAEEDNVTLTFAAANVRRFRIEAVDPAYLASLRDDNWPIRSAPPHFLYNLKHRLLPMIHRPHDDE